MKRITTELVDDLDGGIIGQGDGGTVSFGLDGTHYGPFGGLCLEAQRYPDSLNRPDWPSVIVTPEAPYRQHLQLEIAPV